MIDWNQVKINAAISAAQGLMESGKLGIYLEIDPVLIAEQSIRVANALVEQLKKEVQE